ncbi:MAG: hypothetical protein M1825_003748 [Sarcosagium campestre]|nr:MAG: hypothetical protein M1825_003748 [Sarcosagium campestre]
MSPRWRTVFRRSGPATKAGVEEKKDDRCDGATPERWTMGMLNDRATEQVPGTVLLLSGHRNKPLGLNSIPATSSASSLPTPYISRTSRGEGEAEAKKRTSDGRIILDPQPDESLNDPLNWPAWKRDTALLSLGLYCMIGGGMTPILAAGFNDVSVTYNVSIPKVALTTGLYMMGLGLGSVISSPTAILYGKRPIYLFGIALFLLTAVWCALSPTYGSLVVARIVQGIAVSPCESLPSATIAEIFFLHERAYRVGIYTLLLLGGKNLIPLVSAAIIQSLGWRWVFWIVAIVVGFCAGLVFFFVPETFWDRTPRPKSRRTHLVSQTLSSVFQGHHEDLAGPQVNSLTAINASGEKTSQQDVGRSVGRRSSSGAEVSATWTPDIETHVGWVDDKSDGESEEMSESLRMPRLQGDTNVVDTHTESKTEPSPDCRPDAENVERNRLGDEASDIEKAAAPGSRMSHPTPPSPKEVMVDPLAIERYTSRLRTQPARTFQQSLKPWNGRLRQDSWLHVAVRPFILFAYPAVLWSTLVYSLSVGWLIVLSESVAHVYRNADTYNFDALQTGMVYISPFVGGILGTAVAGKVSDAIVRFMSRRNGGVYEPEFRLVMAAPVALTTCIGLMGFGWSAQERDRWIVPTIFFGVISFGCCLGSTTAITFCVDSYRQYAGEALVTLNFSKNIFHGLVFSLFFNEWLESDGSKTVFLVLGGIQLACLLLTIPMYIFGKRARMWTVRRNLMEKF